MNSVYTKGKIIAMSIFNIVYRDYHVKVFNPLNNEEY